MRSALTKSQYKAVIDVYFNKIAPKESLVSLNTAFTNEGEYRSANYRASSESY